MNLLSLHVLLFGFYTSQIYILLNVYITLQIFEPWIQKRRLEFVKHKNLILSILQHVQKHALGNILTADGAPNVNAIKRSGFVRYSINYFTLKSFSSNRFTS